jgi:hypothetical protein
VLALVEKSIISIDVAVSLIVLLSGRLLAHLYDASYWYNRNLVIIANIERQFLQRDDLTNIHYYFGKHRQKTAMLTHLKIQFALGVAIAILFIVFHFLTRVLPAIGGSWHTFEVQRAFPYIALVSAVVFLFRLRRGRIASYEEFLRNSPGVDVDTTGIKYGVGHPPQTQ